MITEVKQFIVRSVPSSTFVCPPSYWEPSSWSPLAENLCNILRDASNTLEELERDIHGEPGRIG